MRKPSLNRPDTTGGKTDLRRGFISRDPPQDKRPAPSGKKDEDAPVRPEDVLFDVNDSKSTN